MIHSSGTVFSSHHSTSLIVPMGFMTGKEAQKKPISQVIKYQMLKQEPSTDSNVHNFSFKQEQAKYFLLAMK